MTDSILNAEAGGSDALAFVWVTVLVTVAAAVRGVWSPCGLSMISAINPFTERSRRNRYWLTALWFIAGSVLGGAMLGGLAAIGAALWGSLPASVAVTAGIACVGCLVAAASDSSTFGFGLPGHPRQVNEQWLDRYRRWVYACGFGVQIGVGFATYIMTAAVYLTVLLGALSGSPAMAFAVGLLFGLVRGLAVLLSSRARDPGALRMLHRRLDQLAPWSLRAAIAVETAGAAVLGHAAAGPVGLALVAVPVATVLVLGCSRSWRRHHESSAPDPRPQPDAPVDRYCPVPTHRR
ncbi:MAG TPA: hypothetical protein VES60_17380 [Nakamurella sp.]|nr:hypothetical protein [Nakamurella sp.]